MLTGNVFRVVLILALLTLAGWATSTYFPTRTTANTDSNAKSNSVFSEGFTSVNWNARVSGWPPTPPNSTPNTLNLGTFTIDQDVERPNTIGDFGVTWLETRKFKNFEHLLRGRR